jgi:hypothetical protein
MRLNAMLQPIQPARLAVDESGLRLMMAEGGKWGAHAPRVLFATPRRECAGKTFDAGRVEPQPGRPRSPV